MSEAVWAPDAPIGQAPYFHVGILVVECWACVSARFRKSDHARPGQPIDRWGFLTSVR
jgi:hypothetical protein